MSFSTQNDYIDQLNDNAQKMFEPWSKLNQAFLKNAEQMTEFSLNTMRSYSDIGLENLRQVANIDSPEAAKDFSTKQTEMINGISQQMLADAQRLTELGKSMQEEVVQVLTQVYGETSEKMQESMQKTADQAAKTAQDFTENMSKMAEKATENASDALKTATKAATNATPDASTDNSTSASAFTDTDAFKTSTSTSSTANVIGATDNSTKPLASKAKI